MRIKELVEAVPTGSSTQPAPNPNAPPPPAGQPPAAPGQQPPPAGQPPGKPPQPSLGNQQPNATSSAPAKPSPEVQQGMQAMSDQFNALKLKYDQLQKQILNPPAQPSTPAQV